MRSPRRLLTSWGRYYGLRGRVCQIETILAEQLNDDLKLRPAKLSGGGQDSIYHAIRRSRPEQIVASLRICHSQQSKQTDEPELPRRILSPTRRILHESNCYTQLADSGISPRVIARADDFLANEWLPWQRVSDVLRKSEHRIWSILPLAISTVRQMHSLGVVHLDLNCGNLVLHPDGSALAVVDFEYGSPEEFSVETLRAFDFIRLLHNFLKPRRGLREIRRQPERVVELLTGQLPVGNGSILEGLSPLCFERIVQHPLIQNCLENHFGPFPRDIQIHPGHSQRNQ